MKDEIQIIENMIGILNRCLVLAITQRDFKQARTIRKDILLCKREIKKIMRQRKMPTMEKGDLAKDAAIR